jgi:uncharacterized protein (DUF2267 family)
MKANEFIKQVKIRAGLNSREEAIDATQATLSVLGERLFGGERDDLAAQLPPELQSFLMEGKAGEKFDVHEFFVRISEEEDCAVDEAAEHARAVLEVLCEAVSQGEIEDIKAQLPKDFAELFEGTRH